MPAADLAQDLRFPLFITETDKYRINIKDFRFLARIHGLPEQFKGESFFPFEAERSPDGLPDIRFPGGRREF